MSEKAKSEKIFEAVCEDRGVQYRKLQTREDQRTADYLTLPRREKVVVETKGIYPNDRDKALAREIHGGGTAGWWGQSRKRVNKTIKKAAGQLREVVKTESVEEPRCPSILMLHDEREVDMISHDSVLEAMYGKQEAHLLKPPDHGELIPAGIEFGGERQMTDGSRLYVSAVGLMEEDPVHEGFKVSLYHNVFASGVSRLDYDTAAQFADEQYALSKPKTETYQSWTRVR